jgi:redox-sensitive bicupin YhaK (pirin superfamily)
LSTVTYLFDGAIRHRDSLGTEMVIKPGDVNLMTAGRGIVHSERSPEEMRGGEMPMSGLQTWLALPDHLEEIDPAFPISPQPRIAGISDGGIRARVVMGGFGGLTSPVPQHTGTLYVDLRLHHRLRRRSTPNGKNARSTCSKARSRSPATGSARPASGVPPRRRHTVTAGPAGARMMLFGGDSIPTKRHIWWNFVSSSRERIEQAKAEWRSGRFDIVPGDEEEFIPLPEIDAADPS